MDPKKVTYFGMTDARNKRVQFGIKSVDRTKHMYIIGKTGMGKSTMLENMLIQDIQNGEGFAFIDPHGGSAEDILQHIPEDRVKDVVYFAPFDMDYPIAFNVMEDVGYDKRHLVVAGLMAAFRKIWVDAWSARMEYILTNVLLALLEYPDSTMLGINKMLIDKAYRKKVVENITDPIVKSFWVDEFANYTDRYTQDATPAIQNKVGQFTGNPLIRNIVGQPKSTFDLRQMMDEKKILICNLSKGKVGEVNTNLLGSMIITKVYLAAMSRADVPTTEQAKLPNFYFYVDEFQSFANESFADILSEARKYKLNLTMAHQYIEQMSEEVRAAVFGNVGTMISFRVGAYDADILEKEFNPVFYANDLVNLGFTQIYLKLMIDGVSSAPFSATTLPPIEEPKTHYVDSVIAASRQHFGRPRVEVEEEISKVYAPPSQVADQQKGNSNHNGHARPGYSERRNNPRREPDRRERSSAPVTPAATPPAESSAHKEQLAAIKAAMENADSKTVPDVTPTKEVHQRNDRSTTPRREPARNHERREKVKGSELSSNARESLRAALASVIEPKSNVTETTKEKVAAKEADQRQAGKRPAVEAAGKPAKKPEPKPDVLKEKEPAVSEAAAEPSKKPAAGEVSPDTLKAVLAGDE